MQYMSRSFWQRLGLQSQPYGVRNLMGSTVPFMTVVNRARSMALAADIVNSEDRVEDEEEQRGESAKESFARTIAKREPEHKEDTIPATQ
ncbi:hypothetical protein SARC_06020 [Sphaeroforma arctica JP610]|uniref:Uncharacterized protein n=1 Tax=Sphaeroforma arctica JP610 TaxID=667725 RepID=A0A0L0FYN6_9EUKA|nr:hypothetical protein SARC_06020 [Sphaeroforma arctica JP610]KNC81666.1 hypothetical protein SARC_06020 [Sphaeroforma arctica JP610]|eukprot:XP_014155568.1 hypothetical protein SARC_06020 [Sphaeroforma arctica JP610]